MHKAGWFDRNQMRILMASLAGFFIMMVLGGIYISYEIRAAHQQADDNAQAVTLLSQSLDSSRKQLTENGITPSAPPAKTIVEGVPGATGAPGKNGAQGNQGPSGPPGPTGAPGPTGQTGKTGKQGSPGAAGQTGPTGAPGANGATGADGKAGETGPQGAAGPPGPAGPQGDAGPAGATGPQGDPGPAGTMPSTITYHHSDGTTETCTEDSGSDTSSASYTCTSSTPTTPPSTATGTGFVALAAPVRPQEMPFVASAVYATVVERKRLWGRGPLL